MIDRFPIDPDTAYTEGAVSLALDIPLSTLATARRSGSLRFVKRGRRVVILGRHLLRWLDPDRQSEDLVEGGVE
jgi:hypothetical protein